MRIAIDFDGTICENRFPDIGRPVPGAFEWMKQWQEAGALLILFTMRSDGQQSGDVLSDAVDFCADHGIVFDGVNEGIGDREWTTSPKVHANFFVDDKGFGCPLVESKEMGAPPMVDWSIVGPEIMRSIIGDTV